MKPAAIPQFSREFRPLIVPLLLSSAALIGYEFISTRALLERPRDTATIGFGIWIFLSGFLAARAFSVDYEDGTLALILSQPISRLRIWVRRHMVVLIAICTLGAVYAATFDDSLFARDLFPSMQRMTYLRVGILCTSTMIAAAAFWSRFARTGIGTYTLVLGTLWIAWLLQMFLPTLGANFGVGPILFSLGLGVLGWLGFSRAQLTGARPTTISAGSSAATSRPEVLALRTSRRHPWYNYILKEVRLQRSAFLVVAVLAVLVLLCDCAIVFGAIKETAAVSVLTVANFIFSLLATVLSGSASITEERSLGTALANTMLPRRTATLFAAKLAVSLVTFGALTLFVILLYVPATLLADLPISLFPGIEVVTDTSIRVRPWMTAWLAMRHPVTILTGLFLVSFWVSTCARDATRTALAAVPVFLALAFVAMASYTRGQTAPIPLSDSIYESLIAMHPLDSMGALSDHPVLYAALFAAAAAIAGGLVAMSFSNFRRVPPSASRFFGQLVLAIGLVGFSAGAVGILDGTPTRIRGRELRASWAIQTQLAGALDQLLVTQPWTPPEQVRTYQWKDLTATGKVDAEIAKRYATADYRITIRARPYPKQRIQLEARMLPSLPVDGNRYFAPTITNLQMWYPIR